MRAFTVYAIKHAANLKALYVLTGVQDDLDAPPAGDWAPTRPRVLSTAAAVDPDGSRDLYFTLIGSNTGTTATEFSGYTGCHVRKCTTDGAFENLPPEWDFGPGA